MKTDELLDLLASQPEPSPGQQPARRFSLALLVGLPLAFGLLLMSYGLRPDLASAVHDAWFWAKCGFAAAMAAAALWLILRLGRPGQAVGAAGRAVVTPVLLVWAGGLLMVCLSPPGSRLAMLLGQSWRICSISIVYLSLPLMATVFWALRGMAPTRLRLGGAAAGLLAAALATLVYSLHCPEMDLPFWALWYVLGLAVPALLGALVGPRVLRW